VYTGHVRICVHGYTAVYTGHVRICVHGYTAAYTARGVYGTYTAVHMCVCIHGPKMAMYTALHGWYKAV